MSDAHSLYRRSAEFAQSVLAEVDNANLDQPTPCEEWDVREAANHLIGGQHYFAMAAAGKGTEPPPEGGEEPDFTAQDMAAAHAAAAEACQAAFTPEVMESTLATDRGDIPGAFLFSIATMENVLHAWDVGSGAGLSPQVPDDIGEAVLGIVSMTAAGARGQGFAEEVEVGEDASITDRIVAMSGRTP